MRVGVVGVGGHSLAAHLPALAALEDECGLELVGIADPRIDAARAAAKEFGFARSFDDPERMLDATSPDVCLLIVPSSVGPSLALRVAPRVAATLIEKPLASDLETAQSLVDELERLDSRVMVSANRRFDPALVAGLDWFGTAPRIVDATMSRSRRAEGEFLRETAVHLVDVLRSIVDLRCVWSSSTEIGGARWVEARLAGEGVAASVRIAPTAGAHLEEVTLWADERSLRVRFGVAAESGFEGWEGGERVARLDTSGLSAWERDGTRAETLALLALASGTERTPVSPRDYLASMRVVDEMVRGAVAAAATDRRRS